MELSPGHVPLLPWTGHEGMSCVSGGKVSNNEKNRSLPLMNCSAGAAGLEVSEQPLEMAGLTSPNILRSGVYLSDQFFT